MTISERESQAECERLLAEVKAVGTPEEIEYAQRLENGHWNVGLGLDLSRQLHRDALKKLLETIEARRFVDVTGE